MSAIGDAFVVLWTFYVVIFVIAMLGPKSGFLTTLSPIISFGKYDPKLNYMIGVTKWFSILSFSFYVDNYFFRKNLVS